MAAGDRLVLLGAIAGAHGVKGLVKIKSFTGEAEAIASYGPLCDKKGQRLFKLTLKGRAGDLLLAAIEGVGDRTTAERLAGTELFVSRAALPPADDGSFYEADLIGLQVVDEAGKSVGQITAFADFGAGPLMAIKDADGKELLLPFAAPVILAVDLGAGEVRVALPKEVEAKEA